MIDGETIIIQHLQIATITEKRKIRECTTFHERPWSADWAGSGGHSVKGSSEAEVIAKIARVIQRETDLEHIQKKFTIPRIRR
jgi:hypothetical protein